MTLKINDGVYNLFDTNAATSTSSLAGPGYHHITGNVSPRVGPVELEVRFR